MDAPAREAAGKPWQRGVQQADHEPKKLSCFKAERLISDLFTAYRSEPRILPNSVQALIEKRGLERTICDYIAGMTDRFALQEHRKLTDPMVKG